MAYDATHPSTYALFRLSNDQLRRRGLSPEQIAELRRVQRDAPPATSLDEVKAATKALEQAVVTEPPAPSLPRRTATHGVGIAQRAPAPGNAEPES